jgi:hypothetical protein
LEQTNYLVVGHEYGISVTQEPESYEDFQRSPDDVTVETINGWPGEMWESGRVASFIFYSGETVQGQRIRVGVHGHRGQTPETVRQFVASLHFGDD